MGQGEESGCARECLSMVVTDGDLSAGEPASFPVCLPHPRRNEESPISKGSRVSNLHQMNVAMKGHVDWWGSYSRSVQLMLYKYLKWLCQKMKIRNENTERSFTLVFNPKTSKKFQFHYLLTRE